VELLLPLNTHNIITEAVLFIPRFLLSASKENVYYLIKYNQNYVLKNSFFIKINK